MAERPSPRRTAGLVYTVNSEVPVVGGCSALRFDASGEIVDAYSILDGTSVNCAGGRTPWDTWISCEEFPAGRCFECDPFQPSDGNVREALGTFQHEAVAVDPRPRAPLPDGGSGRRASSTA